jgi:hypothetical protein
MAESVSVLLSRQRRSRNSSALPSGENKNSIAGNMGAR